MKRSVTAFICGLIGSLFSLFWGFWCGIVGDAGTAIIGSGSDGGGWTSGVSELLVFGWLAFIGAIIGIVGASYCFKNAKKGGILLAIASVMCAILQLYIFINAISAGAFIFTLILVFLLPVVLQVVATVSAFRGKEYTPAPTYQQNYSGYQQQNPEPAGKTLEQELTELKRLFDNGILTEEEFATAKKNAIEKHSK